MRAFRWLLVCLIVIVTMVGVLRPRTAHSAPGDTPADVSPAVAQGAPVNGPPLGVRDVDGAREIHDPRTLTRIADWHRDHGDVTAARGLYEKAIDGEELALYLRYGPLLHEALILEALGDHTGAEKKYRENADRDILYTILALRIASRLPERDALVDELLERVKGMAARVKAGDKAVVIYVTSKGEPRTLEHVPDDQVLPRLRAVADGDDTKKLRYCYIDKVDLTGVDPATIPKRLQFSQCIIGQVLLPDLDVGQLIVSGFVLGRFDLGKTWEGKVNTSKSFPGSRFQDLTTRETVFLGPANFQDVKVLGRKAAFPLTDFEGGADFRGALLTAPADFRFSVFGADASFKDAHFQRVAYFGNARFRKETTFTGLFAEREVYFDSSRFEGRVHFEDCEWQRQATFENASFLDEVAFTATRIRGRLNLSRAAFAAPLNMDEVQLGGMDLFGTDLQADARFSDARFDGKVRFAPDDVTWSTHLTDVTALLPLYRDYQGDEDAAAPLATGTSYGVTAVGDLVARVAANLSFANSVFSGFCVFERVIFGAEGEDTVAEFYNTQFLGETHFERTIWHSAADFTTIYANELAMNEAEFRRTLQLDDANVPGRVTLTDARFVGPATVSFYGAQIATFQVDRSQVDDPETGEHRLWYEQCATGAAPLEGEVRITRLKRDRILTDDEIRAACYDRAIDEYVSLKQSFGDRAMTTDEDWAYWWIKHDETLAGLHYGGLAGIAAFPLRYLLFELAFGWGVRLGNLAVTAFFVCAAFSIIYKRWCGDSIMSYDGDNVAIRDIPWTGVFYISLQSLAAFNTGWDFGQSTPRFKYLNTLHTYMGVLIMTFFVGAYTRMILA